MFLQKVRTMSRSNCRALLVIHKGSRNLDQYVYDNEGKIIDKCHEQVIYKYVQHSTRFGDLKQYYYY